MRVLVQKFGGTSLSTEEQRKLVIKKISAAIGDGNQVVAVVSAMGRRGAAYATDTLKDLVPDAKILSKKDLDLLMSCGEIISSVVLVSELAAAGIQAACLTGGQAGIITDDSYNDARIVRVNPVEIYRELEKNQVVIVAGFQGMTEEGQITTLGRGGSDTTAAALGAALKAHRIDIYTDVDGVKTADPKIVNNAKTLERITYNEICQLAHEGAKVIHPRAVEIAMQANVPLRVLSTFLDGNGTMVANGAAGDTVTDSINDNTITGITQKTNVSQLIIHNPAKDQHVSQQVFKVLAANEISVDFITINETETIFTVRDDVSARAISLIQDLGLEISTHLNCAKVAAVGAGMTGIPGVMSKIVEALTEKNIRILQSADSYTSIWCLVPQSDMEEAVRALHEKFNLG
ncbi:aspartate kinase [Dehalobacterium formicoaceticum]|uniref:Aspartokinase n=1 Tax=Dehalobacterium formicoaceticum TaxID=51515 RepID=A0ABT1Y4W0_9FIRM|nr:aspartate kinase [Dehalobacterium formicoaceticum]MCR6545909.1 aspartate kinase [Dehalobacterium formicoaceticum]